MQLLSYHDTILHLFKALVKSLKPASENFEHGNIVPIDSIGNSCYNLKRNKYETEKLMIYSNPSFETEKHTHAFGAMLWWAVSLISMFTVGTGITAIGLCGASVLKITSTFLQDNTIIVLMLFFAVAIIIFFIGLLRFTSFYNVI